MRSSFLVESRWNLLELKTSGLSLEDIFLKLTTKDVSEDSGIKNQESEVRSQEPEGRVPENEIYRSQEPEFCRCFAF